MKYLAILFFALAAVGCTKKDPPSIPKTLGEQLVGTNWWPTDSRDWTLEFAKDTARYVNAYTYTFRYSVSNDTLTFYPLSADTVASTPTRYKISLSNHVLVTTNIPFDGHAAEFQQVGFF